MFNGRSTVQSVRNKITGIKCYLPLYQHPSLGTTLFSDARRQHASAAHLGSARCRGSRSTSSRRGRCTTGLARSSARGPLSVGRGRGPVRPRPATRLTWLTARGSTGRYTSSSSQLLTVTGAGDWGRHVTGWGGGGQGASEQGGRNPAHRRDVLRNNTTAVAAAAAAARWPKMSPSDVHSTSRFPAARALLGDASGAVRVSASS